ncbi:hypothetical protein [Bacillus phage SDFMU_Pbc]|uniref:Uncharacterized protein n=1 Tax=Bacillus phage SDFMU_Pbc TaxID=3076135 RepID=A0AA96KRR2_9CAUD|nr:hypothetical protein [Bacillus phage SDFMU_Pbc]
MTQINYEKLIKGLLAGFKEALHEELNEVKEGDKIADTLENVFKEKEDINQFIENTVKNAQELAKESKDNGSTFVIGQQSKDNHKSLENAVANFFSLVKSTENAKDFSIGLQDAMALSSWGRFGLSTETGISYGEYKMAGKTLTLSGDSITVYYTLNEEDVTNPELAKELFSSDEKVTDNSCGCVNEYGGELGCIDPEYSECCPELYSIIEDIEETEEEFYNSVEVILKDIIRYYSNNMPTFSTMFEYDEAAMRFFLTHCSTLYSPAAITALSEGELLHEFQRRMKTISHSK